MEVIGEKMEEETFRPQRGNPEAMQRAQDLRKLVAEEAGETVNSPQDHMKITGNIPPQLRQMLEKDKPRSAAMPKKRQAHSEPIDSNDGFGTDTKLQQLIAGLASPTKFDTVELPSKGKLYDGEDGPEDGIIHLRPMTGEEEQILATPRFVKKGQAINMIFDRCMQERYNTENFLTADRTYLLIYLRIISYSHEYDVEVPCPNCGIKFGHTVNLSNDIMVDYCDDDFNPASLSGELPNSGYQFRYRLSRGSDEKKIQDYRERKTKEGGQADDTLIYRMALLTEEIEGLQDTKQIMQLIRHLPTQDLNHIRNLINEPPFGIQTGLPMVCNNCGYEFDMDIPLESNFFSPKSRKKTQVPV